MLYTEIIAVCSENHTKHINSVCGQNVELVMLNLVINVVTTGLFRANIRLDHGVLFVAGGWTCRYYQVKCAKLKFRSWFGVLKTSSVHKRYLELILTSTKGKIKTLTY